VKRYSSGMYVRLAFGVAAHLDAEIMIIDEVLAVGDAEFQKKCMGKMGELSREEGRTVLYVSHNMGSVMQLCESCLLLNEGTIQDTGRPADVLQKYYERETAVSYNNDRSDADIFLAQIFTCDKEGTPKSNFAHKEAIHLRIKIGINRFAAHQNIAVCLLRQDKKRVFTVNRSLGDLYKEGSSELTADFIIEGGLIAPMDYSFLVALNNRTGRINYDLQEDICPVKVYDDGTDLAFAEGMDYGCIILNDKWNLIE
jgi:lipopolysaccharide transport system ATP-binding protein